MPWRICLFSFVFFMFLERETYVFLGGNVRFLELKTYGSALRNVKDFFPSESIRFDNSSYFS